VFATDLRERIWRFAGGVAVLGLVVYLSLKVPTNPTTAIGIGLLFLAAGLIITAPTLLLAGVFATCFAYWRVGPGSLSMSLGDAVTLLALLAAFPFVPWQSRSLRRVLAGLILYLGLLLVSVAGHPTQRAQIEWLHRSVLFGGAILIGAAIAHRQQITIALKTAVYAAAIVAVAAIVNTVTHDFDPAFPFGIHKNNAGPLLAMVAVLLIAAPWQTGIRPSILRHMRVLIIAGVFATQSRGAFLGLFACIAIYAIRHRSARQRAPMFFLLVALTLIVVSVVTLQNENKDNPRFNGVDLRVNTIDNAFNDVWAVHPIVGGGLKYFQAGFNRAGGAEQIFVAELAEAGIVGLVGLLVLLANTLRVLFPRRDPIGEAAFLIFVLMVLYALTAVFWIAGTLTLPMLMVGLAVGDEEGIVASKRARSRAAASW
jgi:hypothetical protein